MIPFEDQLIDARHEAIAALGEWDSHEWSHPIVEYAARAIGLAMFCELHTTELRSAWEHFVEEGMTLWRNGERNIMTSLQEMRRPKAKAQQVGRSPMAPIASVRAAIGLRGDA